MDVLKRKPADGEWLSCDRETREYTPPDVKGVPHICNVVETVRERSSHVVEPSVGFSEERNPRASDVIRRDEPHDAVAIVCCIGDDTKERTGEITHAPTFRAEDREAFRGERKRTEYGQ